MWLEARVTASWAVALRDLEWVQKESGKYLRLPLGRAKGMSSSDRSEDMMMVVGWIWRAV